MPFRNYGLEWKYDAALFNMWGKRRGRPAVDFSHQIGIYTLEKGGKVIYVGKSGTGNLPGIGGRLYGHCYDNKKGKWDRFSWFGIRAVRPTGTLVRTPNIKMDTGDLITDIEAVLIYLLRTPLNQATGRYKHMDKYDQDPRE